ncbi:MAG TPA: M55 family metallopeptidase [Thermoanaerobaculia bacterium]|nr:M55 family metallopeptidase [Thermoanaerobaculia bacterium]
MLFRFALVTVFTVSLFAQPRGLKVYISADMEGVGGVVTAEQLSPAGFEYAKAREYMTEEVLAAIASAREAGATEIVVSDSHGNFQNLLLDKLPKDVAVIRGGPRPLSMMQGIDETFDAVLFIGYHSSTTNPAGVRAHTISSARLADVRINGVSMPEAGINAAIAGHFRVPIVMISGDDVAVAEAKKIVGDLEGAVVKEAYGFHSAKTLTPEAARERIRDAVKRALKDRSHFRPVPTKTPVTLEITFKNYRPAEILAFLPNVERIDAHSVRFVGKDILEVARFLSFATNYEPGLEP